VKVKNLFNAGVDNTLDQDMRARVTASNIVFITIAMILLIILTLNARTYWAHGITSFRSAFPILLFCVSIGGILLNHIRWFLTARLVFFLSWTLLITAFPIWRPASVYGYFLHPMFGIVSSTMVLLMFSFRKEKVVYVSFLIFSMVITVFSFEFVSWFDQEGVAAIILTHTTKFRLHIYPFFFTIFFNLVLIYIFRINGKFFALQQQQHETIVVQNKQLSETRLKLELSNNELEARVRERTLELLEQNTRLTDYAFFHAHVLRAPVSRIRGLLNLMNLSIDPAEEKKIRDLLSEAMKDLDDTIHAMNDKLQATDISRKETF
jgi:hypothetical protein